MASDLVVVIPGILGSTLSKDGAAVWEPSTMGVLNAIRSVGRNLDALALPEGIGDDHPGDGVAATGLVQGFSLFPGVRFGGFGYRKLLAGLRQYRFGLIDDTPDEPGNLIEFPYDWRLSNRYSATRLKVVTETALARWRSSNPSRGDARVVFVCHSMGGLVARWYVEQLGGGEICRAIVTLGTPHRGALNALTELVNGTEKGVSFLKKDLSPLVRSLPSMHQLLPQYACVVGTDGSLATVREAGGLGLTGPLVEDGSRFLDELMTSGVTAEHAARLHPVVGISQPTATTARVSGGRVTPIRTIAGVDEEGDATVPRLSGSAPGQPPVAAVNTTIVEGHGALPAHRAVLDVIEGVLTGGDIIHREVTGEDDRFGVELEPVVATGDPIEVRVEGPASTDRQLVAVAFDESDREADRSTVVARANARVATFGSLAPGAYRIEVAAVGPAASATPAVSAPFSSSRTAPNDRGSLERTRRRPARPNPDTGSSLRRHRGRQLHQ